MIRFAAVSKACHRLWSPKLLTQMSFKSVLRQVCFGILMCSLLGRTRSKASFPKARVIALCRCLAGTWEANAHRANGTHSPVF